MQNTLFLQDSKFRYIDCEFELDDLYSLEMFDYLNGIVEQFYSGNYFDNIVVTIFIS